MKVTAPLLRGGGLLHIVGRHTVHTVADPDGAIHRLVQLADGSRSSDELLGTLHAEYPQIDEHEVAVALHELESAGVLDSWMPGRCVFAGRDRRELAALYT
jgi:hypothetical protein